MPYKDKAKEKIARKRSMSKRIIERILLEFRVGDESLLQALQKASVGKNRNAYIKDVLRNTLINNGFLNNDNGNGNNDNPDD